MVLLYILYITTYVHTYSDELRRVLTTTKRSKCDGMHCGALSQLGPYAIMKETWESKCADRSIRMECGADCACDPSVCKNRAIAQQKQMKLGIDVQQQQVYGIDRYTFMNIEKIIPDEYCILLGDLTIDVTDDAAAAAAADKDGGGRDAAMAGTGTTTAELGSGHATDAGAAVDVSKETATAAGADADAADAADAGVVSAATASGGTDGSGSEEKSSGSSSSSTNSKMSYQNKLTKIKRDWIEDKLLPAINAYQRCVCILDCAINMLQVSTVHACIMSHAHNKANIKHAIHAIDSPD